MSQCDIELYISKILGKFYHYHNPFKLKSNLCDVRGEVALLATTFDDRLSLKYQSDYIEGVNKLNSSWEI